ncbi:QRFP-like peptide receptor [Oculina patagonica]
MANSEGITPFMLVFFCAIYTTIFILSTVGNVLVMITCYKALKRRCFPFMCLVANLASADLLFTLLSLLNAISFLWRWVGGDITCKVQGFLIETTYTTSITTLVIISYERLKAIKHPFNARIRIRPNRDHCKPLIIWVLCLAVCSPLLHIYRVQTTEEGRAVCANTRWGETGRQIYYSLHAMFFFVIPLLYMIFTQSQIHRALRLRVVPIQNSFCNRRHKKVAKTLAALTIAFVLCWSPFMIIRTLKYFKVSPSRFVWTSSQLLIVFNAAIDPILYGYYGDNLKTVLRRILFQR